MYADAHCDTITEILDKGQPLRENGGHVDLKRLTECGCALQFFAVWIDPKYELHMALPRCIDAFDYFFREMEHNKEVLHLIKRSEDMDAARSAGKIGALLSIEGGGVLGGRLSTLRVLYRLGVRAMTLTWNGRNEIADGVGEGPRAGGLSRFGHDVVVEMNRLGMLVDVSHLSERGFWDVAETCNAPFIASHSNAKAVCPHQYPDDEKMRYLIDWRNLTDAQIRCLIERGGFMGINFCPDFLRENGASIDDILLHVEHIMALGGERTLGFGADFDGVTSLPKGISGAQDMDKVINRLGQLGYSDECLAGICYGNLQRVVRTVLDGKERDMV